MPATDLEKERERKRRTYWANVEESRAKQRESYYRNQEKNILRKREDYSQNKEKYSERDKRKHQKRYAASREAILQRQRERYQRNRADEARKQKERKHRRQPDCGIRTAIRRCHNGTISIFELNQFIERRFADSFAWLESTGRLGPRGRRIYREIYAANNQEHLSIGGSEDQRDPINVPSGKG